jgi:hypothetical protein
MADYGTSLPVLHEEEQYQEPDGGEANINYSAPDLSNTNTSFEALWRKVLWYYEQYKSYILNTLMILTFALFVYFSYRRYSYSHTSYPENIAVLPPTLLPTPTLPVEPTGSV